MNRKIIKTLILLILIIFTYTIVVNAKAQPDVTAKSAIVLDQKTGRILYEKNINEKRSMASTTKIMTAIVAIENGNMLEEVKISKNASMVGGSSIWLEENEVLTLKELLYGLMLKSGNDASYAIGEYIGEGKIDNFIEMMNRKAKELEAFDTSFNNTHGLDHENHFTTALDLARISSYGMSNKVFRSIVSTKEKNISWSTSQWSRYLKNTNKMLWMYEGGNGIKTGFTNRAGRCLVSSANKNSMELISVVLHSNDIWTDSKVILDYGYNTYKPFIIAKKDQFIKTIEVINGMGKYVDVYCKDEVSIPVENEEKSNVNIKIDLPESINAPTMKEQIVGNLNVYIGDKLIYKEKLYIKESIRKRVPQLMLKEFIRGWLEVS